VNRKQRLISRVAKKEEHDDKEDTTTCHVAEADASCPGPVGDPGARRRRRGRRWRSSRPGAGRRGDQVDVDFGGGQ
jgi:hypothetical protein